MTTERDPQTRIVLSWLREDAYENAERVLLRALDEVDATPQRRSWWPARRSTQMNRLFLAASAVGAVLVAAIVGYNLFPVSDPGARPTPSPATAPTPTPLATPSQAPSRTGPPLLPEGALAAGTYVLLPFAAPNGALQVTLTVPDGWQGWPGAVTPDAGPEAPGGAVAFLIVTQLYADPCNSGEGFTATPTGATVDDLVRALQAVESSYEVGTPTDVTLDGYSGQRIELVMPSDVDFATCDDGNYRIWEPGPWAQGPGNIWNLWILDVAGTRVVILGHHFPTTPPAVQAQLQDIVASVQIEP